MQGVCKISTSVQQNVLATSIEQLMSDVLKVFGELNGKCNVYLNKDTVESYLIVVRKKYVYKLAISPTYGVEYSGLAKMQPGRRVYVYGDGLYLNIVSLSFYDQVVTWWPGRWYTIWEVF